MTSSDIRLPKLLRSRVVVAALSAGTAILASLSVLSITYDSLIFTPRVLCSLIRSSVGCLSRNL